MCLRISPGERHEQPCMHRAAVALQIEMAAQRMECDHPCGLQSNIRLPPQLRMVLKRKCWLLKNVRVALVKECHLVRARHKQGKASRLVLGIDIRPANAVKR